MQISSMSSAVLAVLALSTTVVLANPTASPLANVQRPAAAAPSLLPFVAKAQFNPIGAGVTAVVGTVSLVALAASVTSWPTAYAGLRYVTHTLRGQPVIPSIVLRELHQNDALPSSTVTKAGKSVAQGVLRTPVALHP